MTLWNPQIQLRLDRSAKGRYRYIAFISRVDEDGHVLYDEDGKGKYDKIPITPVYAFATPEEARAHAERFIAAVKNDVVWLDVVY